MSKLPGYLRRDHGLVEVAAECLFNGGVVFLPTDTVFGLAALPHMPNAVAKIFELKARPVQKNLPVMVSRIDQLAKLGANINERVERLVSSSFCPGPLSIVVGLRQSGLPEWLAGRSEIAFRIPNDRFLLELLDIIGPLLVTSANRHGMDTFSSVEEALGQLVGRPDYVVHGRECGSIPSTLVNCRFSPPVIERVGAVSPESLSEYLYK